MRRIQTFLMLIVLGVLGALAYAPLNLWPLLPLSLAGFSYILSTHTHTMRQALGYAATYFFSYYAMGMGWVAESFFTVNLGLFSPIAFIGLPLGLSVFPVCACCITFYGGESLHPRHKSFMLGLMLSLAFLIQFLGEFACPWLIPGYAMPLEILQTTAYIGIEGLTVIICSVSCILASRTPSYILTSCIITAGLFYAGAQRLSHNPTKNTSITLRLVQPCIPQILKWDARKVEDNLYEHAYLSQSPSPTPIQAVIWPEAAVIFDFTQHQGLCEMFGHAAPQGGHIIMGSVTEARTDHSMKLPRNSLVVLNEKGDVQQRYDKKHLLPFGEYMPGRRYLPWVAKMSASELDMTPGDGACVLSPSPLPPFRPLICYEGLFSREIWYASSPEQRPLWLLNLTNDAWFGTSFGPYQHLKHVSVRSIEQGIPMVRSANNGISAIIDALGRVTHSLPLNQKGVLDAPLPRAIEPTFYSRYGAWFLEILMSMILLIVYLIKRR